MPHTGTGGAITAVMKWNPLRELERMADRLNRVVSRPESWSLNGNGREAMALPDWVPSVDERDGGRVCHSCRTAGVKKGAVKVTMENGVLTVRGERTQEQAEGRRKHHRVERTYGRFATSFVVPDTVDAGKASAEYAEGMLHLHLPKSEKAKPKQLEVKIG